MSPAPAGFIPVTLMGHTIHRRKGLGIKLVMMVRRAIFPNQETGRCLTMPDRSFPKFFPLPYRYFEGAIPRTEINLSYNYQDRPEYTSNIISTTYRIRLFNVRFAVIRGQLLLVKKEMHC